MRYALGIIGAGNMAEAIVRGVLAGGGLTAGQVVATARTPERRAYLADRLDVAVTADNREAASGCDTLMLGVKPQVARGVLAEVAGAVAAPTLVVSIMAGLSAATIDAALGGGHRVVRTMPNTPVLVGAGMVAVARGERATDADVATVRALFAPAAVVVEVAEPMLDAVVAVSGSGPAYFFYLVEQMTAAGVSLGLSADQAHQLATQTALGAAKMMTAPDADPPRELRRRVTSPNGTTQAAIETFDRAGLPGIVADAMAAAARRSRELGG